MAHISGIAPPGSLLKKAKAKKGRQHDGGYLALIRACPCVACGRFPAGEAAHVRMSSAEDEKKTGMGVKPDDKWTLPLCHEDHMEQHRVGEAAFWSKLGIDPLVLCKRMQDCNGNLKAMQRCV